MLVTQDSVVISKSSALSCRSLAAVLSINQVAAQFSAQHCEQLAFLV